MIPLNMPRAFALVVAVSLLSAGCHLPAQVAWSPDGTRAGYRVDESAYLIDQNGKVIQKLGRSLGGLAWTADSKTLYFAAADAGQKPVATEASTRWTTPPTTQPVAAPANDDPADDDMAVSLSAWTDGQIKALCVLADPVVYMELSPDQKWLSIIATHSGRDNDRRYWLYVYHIGSKKLDLLSESCRPALCFTGPHRLASIEAMPQTNELVDRIIERDLDETAAELKVVPLVDTVAPFTNWLAASGEDVLFTALPFSFPGQPLDEENIPPRKLYQYTRKNKGIAAIADQVGERFLPGPGGKRILFEKITPATAGKPAKRHLAVMNANGSDARDLMELTESDLPVWPAWKDADQISFQSGKPVKEGVAGDGGKKLRWYDLVLYRIDTEGLTAVRTLSDKWPMEMKPQSPVAQDESPASKPVTAPATRP